MALRGWGGGAKGKNYDFFRKKLLKIQRKKKNETELKI